MFSLKLDVLFPDIRAARELARRLNDRHGAAARRAVDPREIRRIREELREARDASALYAVEYRNGRF